MPRFVALRSPHGLAPLDDIAIGPALLAAAATGGAVPGQAAQGDELIRLTCPAPTLSFSRLDTLAPGFAQAVARARAHGFVPVVRGRGGRAAAYHDGCVLVDHVGTDADARMRITPRFERTSSTLLQALAGLGVDAAVGALPGEYCPGDHSIHAALASYPAGAEPVDGSRRRVKIVGTAQRVVRAAWLVSAVVVVDGADALRDVLVDVYDALGMDWDPSTVGSVALTLDRSVTTDDVQSALLGAYAVGGLDGEVSWTSALLDAARGLADRHDLPLPVR